MFFNKFQLAVVGSALSLVAVAAEVEISARGGVIPNDDSAEVIVANASGSGSWMTLEADQTKVSSLTQRQMVIPAVVFIGDEQCLALGLARMVANAQSLTLGKDAGKGELGSDAGLTLQVDDAASVMSVNANLRQDGTSQYVEKQGDGSVSFAGDLIGTVRQRQGNMVYDNFSDGARLTIAGKALYDYCSNMELAPPFTGDFDPTAQALAEATVITAENGVIPVASFQVNGGSVIRVDGAVIHQPEASSNLDTGLDQVPACGVVGSNSVGVITFNGGSYTGNLVVAVGGSEYARGVLRICDHAEVMNVTATNAVQSLGASGYANVDIEDSTYLAAGHWQGAVNGQLMLSIIGGTFSHLPTSVRPSSVALGGNDSDTAVYIGAGGLFDASEVVGGQVCIPALNAENAEQVSVVVQGGEFDLGTNTLHLMGNADSGKSLMVVRDGGVFRAAAANGDSTLNTRGYLVFDNGKFVMTGEANHPFGGNADGQGHPTSGVYSFGSGLTLEVPAGKTAVIPDGGTVSGPTGKGIDSVTLPSALAEMVFVGPPVLRFVDTGSGAGASAICEFDRTTGKITAIRVTSRGWGYGNPRIQVYYGSPTEPVYTITSEDIATSDSAAYGGGLTKTGAGTLILEGTNTYTGATSVEGGVLKLAAADVIKTSGRLALYGDSVFDLNGFDQTFADYGGDGQGVASNGLVTVTGLEIDLKRVRYEDFYETLNLKNVKFQSGARLMIRNAKAVDLSDTSKEYLLYKVSDGVPTDFPMLDPAAYLTGLPETWAVVQRGEDEIVLKYIGGSIFIYY